MATKRTVIRTPMKMISKKERKVSRGGRTVSKPLSQKEQAYNKAVSEYNKAIQSGDYRTASSAAQRVQQSSSKGQLTQQQQQQLDALKAKLEANRRKAEAELKAQRQAAAAKAAGQKPQVIRPEQIVRLDEPKKREVIQMGIPSPPKMPEPSQPTPDLSAEVRERLQFPKITYTPEQEKEIIKGVGEVTELYQKVEEIVIPKYLDEPIYLPDKESIDQYKELLEESNVWKGGFRGGEIRPFLEKQQEQLEKDIAEFEKRKAEAEAIVEKPMFKKLELGINKWSKELNALASKENITEADVKEYERIKKQYDKAVKQYYSMYEDYRYKIETTAEFGESINKGIKGTGWKFAKESEKKYRAEKDIPTTILASDALKGFTTAYDVEKTALVAQVGGAVAAKTTVGKSVIGALGKPRTVLAGKSVGGILSTTPVVGTTAGVIGVGTGMQEYKKSADIGYSIAAGIGGAAGFTAVTAGSALAARSAGRKPLDEERFKQLQKAEGQGEGRILKFNKDKYRILVTETKQAGGYTSKTLTGYDVEKVNGKWVIRKGAGANYVYDRVKGELVRKSTFDFGGRAKPLSDKVYVKGRLLENIKNLKTSGASVKVNLKGEELRRLYTGIGFEQGDDLIAYVSPASRAQVTDIPRGKLVIKTPEGVKATGWKPDKRIFFKPTSRIEFKQLDPSKQPVSIIKGSEADTPFNRFFAEPFQTFQEADSIDDWLKSIKDPALQVFGIDKVGAAPRYGGWADYMKQVNMIPPTTETQAISSQLVKDPSALLIGQAVTPTVLQAEAAITPVYSIAPQVGVLNLLGTKSKTDIKTLPSLTATPKIDTSIGVQELTATAVAYPTPTPPTPTPSVTRTVITTPTPTPITPPIRPPRPRPPTTPPITGFPLPPLDIPKGKRKVYKPHYAEYIPEGQEDFKRIHKKPKTMAAALDTMAEKVDKFRSAVGRVVEGKPIVQKKKKKSPLDDKKTGYFKRNKNKFRTFSVSRTGQRSPLPKNTFVEKKAFRKDKPLERRPAKRTKRTPFGF